MANIGGSLLPSTPNQLRVGEYEVRPLPEIDTHGLFWHHETYASLMATHPNGYSCLELAKRLQEGDKKRVIEQVEYILSCAGTAAHIDHILNTIHQGEKVHE